MECKCEFKFSGPGEFRNCAAFVTAKGESGVVCPKCDKVYVDGKEILLKERRRNAKVSKVQKEHLDDTICGTCNICEEAKNRKRVQ